MLRLILLVFILTIAGILHLMDPYSFVNAIPLFIPFKLEIVYVTGLLEFVLALGLILRKSRALFAKVTAAYFVFLLPVHFYISMNVIPMFGVSDPTLLWARTFFQFILIWWAFALRKV